MHPVDSAFIYCPANAEHLRHAFPPEEKVKGYDPITQESTQLF